MRNNMFVLVMCTIVLAAGPVGCTDPYLQRISALAEFEEKAPVTPRGDAGEVEAVFAKHKGDVLRPLLPFARTFEGGEYPHLKVSVSGEVSKEHDTHIIFTVNILGASTADRLSGWCTADRLYGLVLWDRTHRAVKQWSLGTFRGFDIPPGAVEKATAIAGAHDRRYTKERLATSPDCVWLPAPYVDQIIFARAGKPKYKGGPTPPLNVAEEYKAIKENTGHNLIMLKYGLGRPEGSTALYQQVRHFVFVDIELGRVVGVNERILYTGPVF